MPLKIIGAGASRTGTLSLKLAIEELGFSPCHHFFEFLRDAPGWTKWERVFDGAPIEWDEVYAGYPAAVDAPTCWFWRELIARYPDAKVILTVRGPESWLKSIQTTVGSEANYERLMKTGAAAVIAKAGAALARRGDILDPGLGLRDPEAAVRGFTRHNEAVRRAVPPERLLVYEVSEGWAPLCGFLGVPVPDAAFPRANSATSFQDWIDTGRIPV